MKNYTNPTVSIVKYDQNDVVRTSSLSFLREGAGREYTIDELMSADN